MTFLLTNDLNRPVQNYSGLIAALRSSGAVQIALSTWLLSTSENAAQTRDRYQRHTDGNDSVFVCAVGNWAYGGIMNTSAAVHLLPL